MSSPPITDRTYAYFKVTGSGSCDVVEQALGLECTNSWSEGDIRPQNGRPYKFMSWKLESGLDDTHDLREHIECLFEILIPLEPKLVELSENYELTLQCVGYFHPTGHGIHFTKSTAQKIASLCLSVDADFYYIDDHGHDLDFNAQKI